MTSRAPAAKPSMTALASPLALSAASVAERRWPPRDDRDDRGPQEQDLAALGARLVHVARAADRLGQVRDEDRDEQAGADAFARRQADAEHDLLGHAVEERPERQGGAGVRPRARPRRPRPVAPAAR